MQFTKMDLKKPLEIIGTTRKLQVLLLAQGF